MTDAYVRPDILVRKVTRGSEVLVNYSYLARLTGEMPDSNVHAHHIFPKGVDGFNQTSINPNDPRYGIWLDKDLHLGEGRTHKYNEAWIKFLGSNPNPTNEELFDQARKLMKEIYETDVF